MNSLFPMAFGSNYFAMTGLMVYLSLVGKSELAADVGIAQACTAALFYAFSGNARNLILNKISFVSADNILAIRYALIFPLSIAAAFLCIFISHIAWMFAAILIMRKGSEWISDIYISESEIDKNYHDAKNYITLQFILLLLVFISIQYNNNFFYLSLLLWSISPLISCAKYLRNKNSKNLFSGNNLTKFLPHLGSTAVIGIGVYVFRLVILSLVGKSVAGDLFAAFAIGGFVGSVYVQAIGPSLVLQKSFANKSSLSNYFHLLNSIFVLTGIILIFISWNKFDEILFIGKNGLFYAAIGISLIGGALMIYAQHARIKILQQFENSDVYGPDVLINIIFIASVPFLYYIFGLHVLPFLFLISAAINYIFYQFYYARINNNLEIFNSYISDSNMKYMISGLIIIPIFFQLNSGVFNDKSLVFDTKGLINNLPIPVSVLACMVGFIMFNDYKKSKITLTVVLMLFVIMLISTVATTNGEVDYQQSKMIFMMQCIIPCLALVLGQLIYKNMHDLKFIAKSFLYIVAIIIPSQLVITWFEGESILVSYLYLFSFYQHLQYGCVIVVTAYLFSLFVLKEEVKYKKYLLVLLPLVGVYAAASASRIAILLLLLGLVTIILIDFIKKNINKNFVIAVCLAVICTYTYFSFLTNESGMMPGKYSSTRTEENKIEKKDRSFYMKYYLNGILEDTNTIIFGHKERPDRTNYPSAHNYYIDIAYNFGLISLIPILILIIFTLKLIVKYRHNIISSPSILGITFVTLFVIFIDNSLKVGFRQPYPGIYSFFIWGLLLGVLNDLKNHKHFLENYKQ